ncbi:class I SAM-dependent methyltransferase [Curtanaerobium respiraculi]|uniref:class I SAM-dependent methyltransferase n=1 Tax=Curtanaerobium respiraculi TaxID=2949669 RepID=UPI0024B3B1BA|nr:class I SAM-dependent methyltransferase [Curtanaerobium respiraculi]
MDGEKVFEGVPDTTYIPLVARIYVSKRFPEYFCDKQALALEAHIPGGAIAANSGEYECMASVARSHVIDEMVRAFISRNPKGNVVFLGGGLETTWCRVGNDTAHCYQVDLPDIVAIRRRVLSQAANEELVEGDMFAMGWAWHVDASLPTLLVVSGVWQYFHEDRILQMIADLKAAFPLGELVFDATDTKGLEFTNRYVEKTGNEAARMYFGLDDPRDFAARAGIGLLEVSGFYDDARKLGWRLGLRTRVFMYFADKWGRAKVVHARLDGQTCDFLFTK